MSDVNAYDELLQLERERDEARAERDRYRKALEEIRFLPADFAYERIQRIIREALAGTEDDNE